MMMNLGTSFLTCSWSKKALPDSGIFHTSVIWAVAMLRGPKYPPFVPRAPVLLFLGVTWTTWVMVATTISSALWALSSSFIGSKAAGDWVAMDRIVSKTM